MEEAKKMIETCFWFSNRHFLEISKQNVIFSCKRCSQVKSKGETDTAVTIRS